MNSQPSQFNVDDNIAESDKADKEEPSQPSSESSETAEEQSNRQVFTGFPKTPEDFQQAKREVHKIDAKDNYANIQFFVNQMNCGDGQHFREVGSSTRSKQCGHFALDKPKDCAKFIEEYRNGEYLALAIILAIFEVVSISDLPDIEKRLISFLPAVTDAEGKIADEHRSDPYLSLQSKLAVIGAKNFVWEDGKSGVGFGEKSNQVLVNIWSQFPALRSSIISWLIDLNRIHDYRTTFDLRQIIRAFSKIIALDFGNATREFFSKALFEPRKFVLLGCACRFHA